MKTPVEISGKVATVCAWCCTADKQAELRQQGYVLSHGICVQCSQRELAKLKSAPVAESHSAKSRTPERTSPDFLRALSAQSEAAQSWTSRNCSDGGSTDRKFGQ